MKNPFVFGQTVTGKDFCSRGELGQVQKSLNSGKSVYLVGRHKMGKTSLVANLTFSDKFIISVDFKNCTTKSEVLGSMVKALLKAEEQEQTQADFAALFTKFAKFNPAMALVQGQMQFTINPAGELKLEDVYSLVTKLNDKEPVLFLDNLQSAVKVNKELAQHLVEQAGKFLCIYCEAQDPFSAALKFDSLVKETTLVELGPLEDKKYKLFVQERMAEKQGLSEEQISEALILIGERSYDRQIFFKTWFDRPELSMNQVANLLVEQSDELYEVIWHDLTDNQQNVLVKLAQDSTTKVYSKQFCEELNIQNTNTVIKIIQSLIKKQLLYKQGSEHFIFSPFFKQWILSGN